ncbi:MAG: DUF4114 domain-containing protein [Candidatus Bathyarchaeia archaeon]
MLKFSTSKRLSIICVVTLITSLTFAACTKPAKASEATLIEIFTHLGFTNIAATTIETFPSGTYRITLYAEFAAYRDENELSRYYVETGELTLIFAGLEGGSGYINPPITRAFTANAQFGLSMLSPGPHRYFTETGKNPDGEQHAKIYINLDDPSMFLIGFENLYGAGDRDYNDLVLSLQKVNDPAVGGTEVLVPFLVSVSHLALYIMMIAILGMSMSLARNKKRRFI